MSEPFVDPESGGVAPTTKDPAPATMVLPREAGDQAIRVGSGGDPAPATMMVPKGLSSAEVSQRISEGRTNNVPDAPVRTVGQIMRGNVLTPINAIIGTMFVLIMMAGFPADALFAGVVVSNSIIGIAQELKARRTLRELAVLSAPRARVVRDGQTLQVDTESVVADDILELQPGDQVVVDGEVVAAIGLEVNESLLTGESDPVYKVPGHGVMSGSFVSSGTGWYRATGIGAASYAARLSAQARQFKLANSELKRGVNVVLRWLTVIIPPAAVLLFFRLLANEDRWQEALRGTVAAAVAMVPDGLVLLTSLSFITGVIALARRKALAKELASVELLARVDTLCLDKTGTITTGVISLERIEPLGAVTKAEAVATLAALAAADPSPNSTLAAIAAGVAADANNREETSASWVLRHNVPFSSVRKWAAATFENRGVYHLGAPDVLLSSPDTNPDTAQNPSGTEHPNSHTQNPPETEHPNSHVKPLLDAGHGLATSDTYQQAHKQAQSKAAAASAAGARVLVVTRSNLELDDDPSEPSKTLPNIREPICLVHLRDTVRKDATEIFAFFRNQGVDLKVISGDHPATVAAVAYQAGITGNAEMAVDGRTLSDDPDDLASAVVDNTVFGRITPHQKRTMIRALRSRGRTVAMTGDGVNDVLALKDADMGIAMGTGSSSTRAVAQLVLLDDRFATLPRVLAEGRRVINNIERVSNLFITKAAYAVLLTTLIGLAGSPFPFLPRQLTLIGTFSTGVPGFFLALAANDQIVKPGFLRRVLRFSMPAGVVAATVTFALYETVRRFDDVSLHQARTCATMTLLGIGLVILLLISRPMQLWKVGLVSSAAVGYAVTMAWSLPRDFFRLSLLPAGAWVWVAGAVVVGGVAAWLAVEFVAQLRSARSKQRLLSEQSN